MFVSVCARDMAIAPADIWLDNSNSMFYNVIFKDITTRQLVPIENGNDVQRSLFRNAYFG